MSKLRAPLVVTFVVAVLAAIGAAPAAGCASFMTFGGPPAVPGSTPEVPPGSQMTISGHDFDTSAATPVRLHWGDETGPVAGEVPIGADGTWTITIEVPDAAAGTVHRLTAEARAADGSMAESLPIATQFAIRGPTAGTAPNATGGWEQPSGMVRTPVKRAPRHAAPQRHAATARPAPGPKEASRVTLPSATKAAPVPSAAPRPVRVVAKAAPPATLSPPTPFLGRVRREPAPSSGTAQPRLSSAAAPTRAAHARNNEEILLLVAGLAAAATLGAAVWWRRRGPAVATVERPSGGPPPADAPDAVEAELQQLLAEESARRAVSDRVGSDRV